MISFSNEVPISSPARDDAARAVGGEGRGNGDAGLSGPAPGLAQGLAPGPAGENMAAATAVALINAAPVGVCTVDWDGRVRTWNAACERMFGWPAGEIVGRPVPLSLDSDCREFGGLRTLVLAGASFADIETVQRRRDGTPVFVSLSAAPLRDGTDAADGPITGVVLVAVDVTERQRAAEEQQKFVSFAENSADLVAMLGLDGRLAYLNDAGRRLAGVSAAASVVGMPLADLHPRRAAARFWEEAMPAALADGTWEGELRLRPRPPAEPTIEMPGEKPRRAKRSRRGVPVRATVFALVDPTTGRQTGLAAVYRDLTEQKRSERTRRRHDTLLNAVARASARLLAKTDFRSAVEEGARVIGEAAGVDRVNVMSLHHSPAADRWLLDPCFHWSRDAGSVGSRESGVGSGECGPGGAADLDTPDALHPTPDGLSPDPATSSDPATDSSRHLPAGWYDRLAGGSPVWGSAETFEPSVRESLNARCGGCEVVAVLKVPILIDGRLWGVMGLDDCRRNRVWTEPEVAVLSAMAGCLGGAIARRQSEGELIIRNEELAESLDRQAAMTGDLARAREAAEAANEAKSAFLAHMSHEIRTPMTAIIGYGDLLLERDQTAEDRLNCVQTIRRNARHLLDLINDILDVSKIEAGKMQIERVDCSPWQVVADVASTMRGRATEKKLKFEVDCGTVPDTARTDPTRLRQVLINLVGNAVKFTDAGGVSVGLESVPAAGAAGATGGDCGDRQMLLRFTVRDSGIGMSADQLGRLFQPFAQADSSITRRFGGTGLGLTICKRLAEMLGGELTVASVPGQGSTFTLDIPADVPACARMLVNPSEALVDGPPASGTTAGDAGPAAVRLSGRVLLADDGPDNRRLLSLYLRRAGAEVEVVENGLLACERAWAAVAAGEPFGVVLMDMQMPELDGYAAATRLRAEGYAGPIVALTAHAMAEDRAKCLKAGCTDYLSKPVDREALIDLTASYLAAAGDGVPGPPTAAGGCFGDDAVAVDPAAEPDPSAELEPLRSTLIDDDPEMRELVDLFVAGLPPMVDDLRRHLDGGNGRDLCTVAHRLKGTGGGIGFPQITRLAADAEDRVKAAPATDPGSARPAVESLIATLRRVDGYRIEQELYDAA